VSNPRQDTFNLKKGVEIYGGFRESDTSVVSRDLSDPENYSKLDGWLEDEGTRVYHVVTVEKEQEGLLDGFVIQNGSADGSSSYDGVGGGVFVEKGALSLNNCEIRDNDALRGGGGIHSYMSTVYLVNTTIRDNTSASDGGGMYVLNSYDVPIHLSRCRFIENTASESGGALFLESAWNAVIHNTEFSYNQSETGFGGGIASGKSDLSLANDIFFENLAEFGAGLSSDSPYWIEIDNSTFVNNEAVQLGNSAYFATSNAGSIDISSSIFWSDHPQDGPCHIDTKLVSGTISITYSNMQECDQDTNVVCDASTCISPPADPSLEAPNSDGDAYILEPIGDDSPGTDIVPCDQLPWDILDLDGDNDPGEVIPRDMAMSSRCFNGYADIGAYEIQ
jgi:predicted outer membrane repeat protein